MNEKSTKNTGKSSPQKAVHAHVPALELGDYRDEIQKDRSKNHHKMRDIKGKNDRKGL